MTDDLWQRIEHTVQAEYEDSVTAYGYVADSACLGARVVAAIRPLVEQAMREQAQSGATVNPVPANEDVTGQFHRGDI